MGKHMTTPEIIDEIQRLMGELAGTDWEHRTYAEFMELLEDGDNWVTRMRNFLGAK